MAVLRLMTSSNLVGCLHRQVGRLLALEDAIDVAGCAPVLVGDVRSVGDQAAAPDEERDRIDRGQSVPSRERDDQLAMHRSSTRSGHDQAAIRGARERRDGALDLADVAHVDRHHSTPNDGATA